MIAAVVSVLVLLVLLPAIALLVGNQRSQERVRAEHTSYLYAQAERREQRIRELEDALYARHAAVLELPNINRELAAPVEEPLPTVVQRFVDGFEDPESREEYEAEARRLLRTRSPDATVAALMAPVS